MTYSPTQRKNYPIQGLGGQITKLVWGRLFRWWLTLSEYERESFKFVNTVHDCVWIDMKEEMRYLLKDVVRVMESVGDYMLELWGIEVPFTFHVAVEIGRDMYSMEHVDKIELEDWI
jgi:hypothetical protein